MKRLRVTRNLFENRNQKKKRKKERKKERKEGRKEESLLGDLKMEVKK